MAKDTISILDGSTFLDGREPVLHGAVLPHPPTGTVLRILLGLEPDGDELRTDLHLPDTSERIELTGVPGRWGRADVSSVEEVTNVA